ncbi:hypothetical protein [Solilutibacter tolerans]|uniref:Uncharacterized protein n=1 Tax=Solilutibacter tolerans TaxID=1604334 RepID=A0A1N6NG32_9GAMM|nr:hypothetical protein [Lysobacter tolerans]SIP91011.1 hypothetical protein SAMN05421546_0247 [Lysobacter tolerans]
MRQLDWGALRARWLVARAILAAAFLGLLMLMALFDSTKLLQAT